VSGRGFETPVGPTDAPEAVGHHCDSAASVVVYQDDGTPVRIPIVGDDGDGGLRLTERKDGPTALTRRAEVTIPLSAFGESWVEYVGGFGQNGPVRIAEVRARPIDGEANPTGRETPILRGFVEAVGSREGVNKARFRILDPFAFLGRIPADVSFAEPKITDVLDYVAERLTAGQDVFESITTATVGVENRRVRDMLELEEVVVEDAVPLVSGADPSQVLGQRKFAENRDTLADVIEWLAETADVFVHLRPAAGRGIELVASNRLGLDGVTDLRPDSDAPPFVIENEALYEMRPVNALRLKGDQGFNIRTDDSTSPPPVPTPFGSTYPEVVVQYDPLVERYGGQLVRTQTSALNNLDRLERQARSRLKELLDGVSGGGMRLTFAPHLRPYETVLATPACAGIDVDVDPLRYEVQRATHTLRPDGNVVPHTDVQVSVSVNREKISETEKTVVDTLDREALREETGGDDYTGGLTWGIGS
jgi:hypothetical protein